MPSYIDLSHDVADGVLTHKGLPAPIICDFLSREDSRDRYTDGTEFHIAKIEMVANTGTYLDCPFHRFEDGKQIHEFGLERFVEIDAVVVRANYQQGIAVGVDHFRGLDVRGRAVLVNTGWAKFWNTPEYFESHPFLTAGAAEFLVESGALLVGIDSMNIDDTRMKNSRPVHTILLGADVLIVEHLCGLELVPNSGFKFTAAPPKFHGVGTFPVRAYATVER